MLGERVVAMDYTEDDDDKDVSRRGWLVSFSYGSSIL
jgi:hypothetical protein